MVNARRLGQSSLTEIKTSPENILRHKTYPILSSIVKAGGHRALEECRKLFKNEIWNCTLDNKHVIKELPIFVKTTLPYATKETAFIHAISTAAIIQEITLQCRMGNIPGCGCAVRKERKGNGDWQWGGCGDNIRFGEKETRRFINILENGYNARTAFNLHNNEIGRKVVRLSLKRECKCHGVTGSCNLKTCWRQLAPFEVIGSKLKLKYRNALQVSFVNKKLQERSKNKLGAKKKDKKLVYLDSSPDYCVRNTTAGSPGMLGRICRSDDVTTSRCKSLCNSCNLKHNTVEQVKDVKCRCRFVWCCSVECDTCRKKYSATTCTL
ncbi:hypothetical protein ACROYT_G031934 [Oculina patagonica]